MTQVNAPMSGGEPLGRFRLLVGSLSALTLMMVLWLLVLATLVPFALGWSPVLVVSESMGPHINAGDIVLSTPGGDVGPGSVITYENPSGSGLVTHRVVDVTPDGQLLTRGDANGSSDSTPIDPASVRGTARLLVPVIGTPWLWLIQGDWVPLAITAALVALAAYWSRWVLPSIRPLTPARPARSSRSTRSAERLQHDRRRGRHAMPTSAIGRSLPVLALKSLFQPRTRGRHTLARG